MVARASAGMVCLMVCVMQLGLNSGPMPSFRGLKPLLKAMRTECCQNFVCATVDRLS